MAYKVIKWLIIPFFAVLLMSQNVNAVNDVYRTYQVGSADPVIAQLYRSGTQSLPLSLFGPTANANLYGWRFWQQTQHTGGTVGTQLTAEFDIRWESSWVPNLDTPVSMDVFKTGQSSIYASVMCSVKSYDVAYGTIKYQCRWSEDTANLVITSYRITVGYVDSITDMASPPAYNINGNGSYYLQASAFVFNDINDVNTPIIQNIDNTVNNINNTVENRYDKEYQAIDNIDNQSPSDIDSGDNQAATNLIGNISGIFNQIRDVPVGSSCTIPANFGNLNLGNLNLCTGKEKMPFIVNFGATVFQLVFVVGTGLILVRQILNLYDWSRK